jgi:hypothetical protein
MGIKMRYTATPKREGTPMKLMIYMSCWYIMVFGVVWMHAVWIRSRARVDACPQEPVLVLKEGETIAAVADWPNGIRFYTEIDVVGGKSEA